jgi:phage terminase large subunit-like protein
MLEAGVPMVEIRPTVLNFSPAMKELDELVTARRLVHQGDPVLAWMVSNVVCHRDAKDNIYPRKQRIDDKIDGAVALIMAISRAVVAHEAGGYYETGGELIVL